jgi:hypothetical protein
MNRVVCQLFAAGLLLAGCQSGLFQTAAKRPAKTGIAGETGTSPWLDGEPTGLADTRTPRRRPPSSRSGADLKMADDAMKEGRLDEAKSLYELVVRNDPLNPSAHHRLASIADRQGDFRTANRHYAIALRKRPDDAELLNDVGWSSFLQKRYTEAERHLKRAVAIDRKYTRAMYNLGWVYGAQRRTELAYQMFLQAGPRTTADRLMKRLSRTLDEDRERVLVDDPASRRRPGDLRAPDPKLSSRGVSQDVVALRREMDRARQRDLALRGREDSRYPSISQSATLPRSDRPEDRYSEARVRRDTEATDPNRRFAPDRASVPPRDDRIATRSPSNRELNAEMRRIDGYSSRGRAGGRYDDDSRGAGGVRNAGYDEPRGRDSHPGGYDGGRSNERYAPRTGVDRSNGTPRGRDDNLFPPDDRNSYPPRDNIRSTGSQRENSHAGERTNSPRTVDPAHREALRLGHNTGAGGVPFPIPNGSRSEGVLHAPDRRRPAPDALRPVAPEPWQAGERVRGSANENRPSGDAARGYGSGTASEMSREFDGPEIRPRSKTAVHGGPGFSEPGSQ